MTLAILVPVTSVSWLYERSRVRKRKRELAIKSIRGLEILSERLFALRFKVSKIGFFFKRRPAIRFLTGPSHRVQ
jgi:hypothetical protein